MFQLESNGRLSREQLYLLNRLVQALDLEQRLDYLQQLGDFYTHLQNSAAYLIDERDYNIYSIVQIGEQQWLGENLRYKGVPHQVREEEEMLLYGCYYTWADVMNIHQRYNKVAWQREEAGHRGIAPEGFCIPSDEDWRELERHLGMDENELNLLGYRGDFEEGNRLKADYSWDASDNNISYNNREERTSFNALAVGAYWDFKAKSKFVRPGEYTYFWSSTQKEASRSMLRYLNYEYSSMYREHYFKIHYYSCRCLRRG